VKIVRRRPKVLRRQFRWWLVPQVFWLTIRSFRIALLVSVLLTAGCMTYLAQWIHVRHLSTRIQSLEQEREQQVLTLDLLEVEITHLTRPQRLEALAVQHLGLSVPSLEQHGILRLVQNDFAAPATTLPTAYTE
jgi:cell division protein FtsL|tara:strand:+ start:307 stop:708 length:402 start_codon:yes stop_codon:yes gene_type:complete